MYLHPSQLRAANTRRVFRVLLARGGCSRAELARVLGLSPVTAGKVVDELLAMGLVEEADAGRTPDAVVSMGRPPRTVRPSASRVLPAIEIGVRRTRVLAVDLSGREAAPGREFATPRTLKKFAELLGEAGQPIAGDPASAVLVSVPGVLDASAERVLFSPNLHWTEGAGLFETIGGLWGAPVCAVQEIQALALGHQAAADAPESFLLVDFGDGVGGAVMTGGQLFHGPMPLAGELGHTGVQGNRRRCSCGSVGCLETLVSRGGLLESFRQARQQPRATWAQLSGDVREGGVEPWLLRSIDAAAVVIAGGINLLGLGHIILTGHLPSLHPAVGEAFGRRVSEHALLGRFGRLDCRTAPRRRSLGLLAAAADRILLPEPGVAGVAESRMSSVG